MSATPPSSGAGHVFLAHSRIERVVHDAAIVPTDSEFSVRPYWEELIGAPLEEAKPAAWPVEFARSEADAPVWFIDVGDVAGRGTKILTSRAVALLKAIMDTGLTRGRGRAKLRIAMPVLGIAGGGLGIQRGAVIAALIDALTGAAKRLDIDVILVTPTASVFSAAQHVRRQRASWPLSEELWGRARELAELARQGHLALFLGAGVSVPAGLPTWTRLIEELSAGTDLTAKELKALHVLDQAELLSLRLMDFGQRVSEVTSRAPRPSLAHALLAGLNCRETVTTNYDRLYEDAVEAGGRARPSVLPWQDSAPGRPWILKLHGDAEHPEDIVLTRRDFVGYDAHTRPAGSILQALLMTRHLLFVGASLNDDNVSRLAYEVRRFREKHHRTDKVGSYLDVDALPTRRELWGEQLHWIDLPGEHFEDRARMMEVFLDAVAAYAATDAPWLLDKRFSGLLPGPAISLVEEARVVHVHASNGGPVFSPLHHALGRLGANADDGAS